MSNATKRIGIDARFVLRPLRGMPLYATMLCRHLPALAPDYSFYFFINEGFEHNDRPESYRPTLEELAAHSNVTIINQNHEGEIKWEQLYLPRLAKSNQLDLLFMPGNRICMLTRIPVVVTIHDTIECRYLKHIYTVPAEGRLRWRFYLWCRRQYVAWQYRRGFQGAHHIICGAHSAAEDVSHLLQIVPTKITTIYHGLRQEFFQADAPKELPGANAANNFCLLLGGDSYQKNPEGTIRAWAKVAPEIRRRFPLKIIGFCGKDNSPLLQTIAECDLQKEVEVRGWVSDAEVLASFKNATLFLFLSRCEGFGFPLLQAMAGGVPVITSTAPTLVELSQESARHFPADDSEAIATGIETVLSDAELYRSLSQKGLQRVRDFTWEKSVAEHLALFRRLLAAF